MIKGQQIFTAAIMVGLVGAAGGCATTSPGSRPDDMSAAHHRMVASGHKKKAAGHKRQYDPKATHTLRTFGGVGLADVGEDYEESYNPTEYHKQRAQEHQEHARQHEAGARALEAFEDASCKPFKKAIRKLCPLMGQVTRVEAIPQGARLFIAKGVPIKALLAHMRCHDAFGRLKGREGMSTCPLYIKSLSIRASSNQRAVEITSAEPGAADKIRRRARNHVAPSSSVTAR